MNFHVLFFKKNKFEKTLLEVKSAKQFQCDRKYENSETIPEADKSRFNYDPRLTHSFSLGGEGTNPQLRRAGGCLTARGSVSGLSLLVLRVIPQQLNYKLNPFAK